MPRLKKGNPQWAWGVDRQSEGGPCRIHFREFITPEQRRHLCDELLITWPWSAPEWPASDHATMERFERAVFDATHAHENVLLVMVYDDDEGRHWDWRAASAQALLDVLDDDDVELADEMHVFRCPSDWAARDAFMATLERVDD